MKVRVYIQIFIIVLSMSNRINAGQPQAAPVALAQIQQQFIALQSANSSSNYRSYRTLLDLFDALYDAVYTQKNNPEMLKALVAQEKVLLTYAKQLFDDYYPKRTTDTKAIMQQWIQDVATKDVDTREQVVQQKEQHVTSLLGHTKDDSDITFAQIILERKQFLTSPCWLKLLTKMPAMNNEPVSKGVVVIQQGDRGQEKYTVKQ